MSRYENTPSSDNKSIRRKKYVVSKDGAESLYVEDYDDVVDLEEAAA